MQRLRSVTSAEDFEERPENSNLGERVRGLKELVFTLLKEVQGLEHEELLSELITPQNSTRLDIERGIKFDDVVRQFETNIIQQALSITGGNQARAARLLGIKPNTLNYKVKLYNLI
ncbi:MAG TPA: helix-turn-helix domain-containing protein [Pyrinomonadaceae bacterium]|nr:helix-turn-helix domain-containing protein [Pyrinomonadaceae bacterium]